MTDEELSISDAILIARLRWKAGAYAKEAADRIEEHSRAFANLQREYDKRGNQIEALVKDKERLGREVNMARYGQPDFAWSIHKQAMADLKTRAERLAATNERLEAALKRVLRNVDEDGVGTVLMIDLIHARAALKGADHE